MYVSACIESRASFLRLLVVKSKLKYDLLGSSMCPSPKSPAPCFITTAKVQVLPLRFDSGKNLFEFWTRSGLTIMMFNV